MGVRTLSGGKARGSRPTVAADSLARLRWLAVLLPTLAIGLFEFLRHKWLAALLPGWLGFGWYGNVGGALVVAGTVYVFVRVFSRAIETSAAQAARARDEAVVLAERQRIAREMHDGVAQALFYLTVKLREVDGLLPENGGGPARAELLEAESSLRQTYAQVREVVADLKRQDELESLSEAIRRASDQASGRMGLRVECQIEDHLHLEARHKHNVVAIVHEALSNARRHGNAGRAALRARNTGTQMILEIADDGTGFDPEAVHAGGGHGLTIMAERARMVGGEFSIDSAPGRGARVMLRVPETAVAGSSAEWARVPEGGA